MMRTLTFVFVVSLLLTVALIGFASTAMATIHPIVSSECAAQESATGAGDTQDPPGQTPGDGAGDGHGDLAAVQNLIRNGALVPIADTDGDGIPDVWSGPAYNGDSGDEHCTNPGANTHPD